MVRKLVKSIQQYQATATAWYDSHNYQFKNTKPHRSVVLELVKSIQKYQATTVAWYGNNNYQFKNTNPHLAVVRKPVNPIQKYQTPGKTGSLSNNRKYSNRKQKFSWILLRIKKQAAAPRRGLGKDCSPFPRPLAEAGCFSVSYAKSTRTKFPYLFCTFSSPTETRVTTAVATARTQRAVPLKVSR